jgi:hypothetical protein
MNLLNRFICWVVNHKFKVPESNTVGKVLLFINTDQKCLRCGYVRKAFKGSLIPEKWFRTIMEAESR